MQGTGRSWTWIPPRCRFTEEQSAYNGYFESTCFHPLLLFNEEGDCLAAKLRPGNGSGHRGQKASDRLRAQWPSLLPVHTPIHASWLNQVEIYFSIVQRKALTPNDFSSLAEVEDRLLRFQDHYEQIATPFQWMFRRRDLAALMEKLEAKELSVAA